MIIKCNSCQKKFIIPDGAITDQGRVVQCGSCGNKWTQYPENLKPLKSPSNKINKTKRLKKNKTSKTKKLPQPFTSDYLEKKYGLNINNNSSVPEKEIKTKTNTGLGFYGFLIFFIVLIIFSFGVLELSKEYLIYNYPVTEYYILSIYETIENIWMIFSDFINLN